MEEMSKIWLHRFSCVLWQAPSEKVFHNHSLDHVFYFIMAPRHCSGGKSAEGNLLCSVFSGVYIFSSHTGQVLKP